MDLSINVHLFGDPTITDLLTKILMEIKNLTPTLADLKAKVDAQTTVEQSVVALLTDLSARLKAAQQDPQTIAAIAAELDANTTALSQAVVSNTPADQAPSTGGPLPPPPPPAPVA